MIEKLLSGGPRQATDAYMALSRLTSQGVDLAPLLEKAKSKDPKRRYWIGNLVAESHHRHGRKSEWAAWLARYADDKVTETAFHGLGNSRGDERAYVPLAVQQLQDPRVSATVCDGVFYFLTHLANRDPSAIDATVRAAIESRLDDKSAAKAAKRALAFISKEPVARPQKPARKAEPKTNPAVAAAVRALSDERPAVRSKAAGKLTELLSGDMVDIRSAFPALAIALSDRSVQVRRSAALAVYYAFDLQRGISELEVLVEPVKRAARDADAKVAEHAGWALKTMRKGAR